MKKDPKRATSGGAATTLRRGNGESVRMVEARVFPLFAKNPPGTDYAR